MDCPLPNTFKQYNKQISIIKKQSNKFDQTDYLQAENPELRNSTKITLTQSPYHPS